MRNRIWTAFVAFGVVLMGLAAPAAAAKRIALVVGNDAYENLTPLGKAVNDSRAVAIALEEIGFTVISAENSTRRDMNRRMSEFDASIAPGDTVFFFFAGHGVAIGAENYLLPTDIPKPREGEEGLVKDEAHSVDSIIARIRNRGAAVSMVVLDACRDNPFAASGTRNLGAQRGLARIDTPDGVFVLYSAGIGQTALDALGPLDVDQNSVFTRKLVPLLRTGGMTHVALAKTVQQQVDALAGTVHHAQQPAYYDQIIGEIVLKPKSAEATADSTAQPVSEAAEAWVTVNNSTSIAVLEAYIARYQGTVFADMAKVRLEEVKTAQVATLVDRTITIEPKAEDSGAESAKAEAITETPAESEAATAETTVVASAETPDATEVASAETGEIAEEPADPALLARQLQTELSRVGCYAGEADGDWGRGSASALERFNEAAGLELSVAEPSGEALDAVTEKQETVCEAVTVVRKKVKRTEPEPKRVKRSEPEPKKITRTKPKSEPKRVTRVKPKSEPKPVKKATAKKRTKTVTSEPTKPKSRMTKSGKFDCSIHGTNTALQDLHRRNGSCE